MTEKDLDVEKQWEKFLNDYPLVCGPNRFIRVLTALFCRNQVRAVWENGYLKGLKKGLDLRADFINYN